MDHSRSAFLVIFAKYTLSSMNAAPASAPTVGMECPVCNELFNAAISARKPRLLACAHTFCTTCVGRFQIKNKTVSYVRLPSV